MFVHYRTQGFIFKKEDRGEADQLFTIYTKDFGRLEILGKGIRKISSKLRSRIDIFYLSEIEFIQGKTYKTLIDAIPLKKFENLRKILKRLAVAYRMAEVLDNLIRGQEADEKIWQLINETLEKLNSLKLPIQHCQLIYYYFLWNLLSFLGYQPQLYNCLICQKKLLPKNLYFDPKEGGIICQNCFKKIGSGKEIEIDIVKILRIVLERDWQTLSRLKIELKYIKALESISKNYLSFILGEKKL
jgi:DNA repair protein RecO (recombination protein O)